MRRLSRPSSITIYVAMWPFPLTSCHASFSADPQTWQVCCGGYWSLLQAVQCCRTSRFSFTASQKGLLNASGTGISFGIDPLRAQGDMFSAMPNGRLSLPAAAQPWGSRSIVQVCSACQSALAAAWELQSMALWGSIDTRREHGGPAPNGCAGLAAAPHRL